MNPLFHQYAITENTGLSLAGREGADVAHWKDGHETEELSCAREDLIHTRAAESVEHEIAKVVDAAGPIYVSI